jgi:hypothetical protein
MNDSYQSTKQDTGDNQSESDSSSGSSNTRTDGYDR